MNQELSKTSISRELNGLEKSCLQDICTNWDTDRIKKEVKEESDYTVKWN